ncbi:hypothetical protein E3U43_002162, partial [Larimichthys crocea]
IRDLKTAVGTWKGDGEGILSGKKGPEQIQGSLRNQVLQSESCSMEQKSIIAK